MATKTSLPTYTDKELEAVRRDFFPELNHREFKSNQERIMKTYAAQRKVTSMRFRGLFGGRRRNINDWLHPFGLCKKARLGYSCHGKEFEHEKEKR